MNCLCFKGCHCLGCFPPHASKSACNELIHERVCLCVPDNLLVAFFAVDMFIDLQLWTWDCCITQVALGVCWKLEIDYGTDHWLRKCLVRHKGHFFTQIHLAAMKALSMCIPNLRGMDSLPPSPFMFTTCSWILIHWFVHVSWNWKTVLWTHDDFH